MLTLKDGKKLIKLARETISLNFEDKKPDLDQYKEYDELRGVFVTLHKNDELRGCIGYPTPVFPLNEAIQNASLSAAFEDPRFPPLSKDELDEVSLEVSVLTVPQELRVLSPDEYLSKIVIGRDGLIAKNNLTSGLLLPQVATEWGWDVNEFLEHTCQKANMPQGAWREHNTRIFTFQAQIFYEKDGDVIEKSDQ